MTCQQDHQYKVLNSAFQVISTYQLNSTFNLVSTVYTSPGVRSDYDDYV